MSEPKLISPMLDNYLMGDPISDHHGVRCCPAMAKDSDKKYIVKIISIPASQVQLDALLLAGAYKDSASALEYFKELSNGVVKEAQVLQRLSKLEGFLPYESWQIVPMENEVGYDVYLLSPYKRSLQRFFKKHTMTHLGAVNLGLDLCASMAVCRHAGVLYVDLKPENIFISEDNEYRISDLGFIPLNSLKYTSLPDKYRSAYTAPEIKDAYSSLNSTIDIYAIGLILYQAFNGGVLPFEGQAPEEPLPPPQYADYEMAEIILKACAPNPDDRWQDPTQMGQAIVSYMQRNGANDVPIIPVQDAQEPAPASDEAAPEPDAQTEAPEDPILEQIIQSVNEEILAEAQAPAEDEQAPSDEEPEGSEDAPEPSEDAPEPSEDAPELSAGQDGASEEDPADLSFLDSMVSDETAPDEATALTVEYHELSDETSDILSQADALIAHETPDPVVAPEPIDVPMPPPIVPKPEDAVPEDDSLVLNLEIPAQEDSSEDEETDFDENFAENFDEEADDLPPKPHKKIPVKRVIGILVVLLILAGLLLGGYYFYREYYLLPVDMQLEGTENQLSVKISSTIDESLLTVVCKDTYGNVIPAQVTNGTALFSDLKPNTQYQVSIEVSGFHKLTGITSGSYNTPAQTDIIQFDATTGTEDGSVILNFTVDGKEPEQWSIVYSAEGEEEQTVTFSGHIVTIRDLVIGKEYTFHLVSPSPLYIVGNDTITYTAMALVYAQDLAITSCQQESLSVAWEAPEDYPVNSWTVRCYNEDSYDQTIVTDMTQAVFTGIDTTLGYTVEVTAEGMLVGTHAYVTANSVTVSNMRYNVSDPTKISLTWDFAGPAPEGGWLLLYTIDDMERQEVVPCTTNTATISPMVPDSHYAFTLQTASGSTVFNGTFSLDTPVAAKFSGYRLTAGDFNFTMCLTPDKENWTNTDVSSDAITTTFQVGQKASFMVRVYSNYDYDMTSIVTMFVIRDENGKLISNDTDTRAWANMWHNTRCELNVPALPDTPGEYTVTIYFNGAYAGEQEFTMTAAE